MSAHLTLFRKTGMVVAATLSFLIQPPVAASPRIHGLLSVGEAPYQHYDMMDTGALLQAGLGLEYAMRLLSPYMRVHAGSYNGFQADATLGVAAGWEFFGLKPALIMGTGAETVSRKMYRKLTEGGGEYLERSGAFVHSVGAQVDILERFIAVLEFRTSDAPNWRMEMGWRLY